MSAGTVSRSRRAATSWAVRLGEWRQLHRHRTRPVAPPGPHAVQLAAAGDDQAQRHVTDAVEQQVEEGEQRGRGVVHILEREDRGVLLRKPFHERGPHREGLLARGFLDRGMGRDQRQEVTAEPLRLVAVGRDPPQGRVELRGDDLGRVGVEDARLGLTISANGANAVVSPHGGAGRFAIERAREAVGQRRRAPRSAGSPRPASPTIVTRRGRWSRIDDRNSVRRIRSSSCRPTKGAPAGSGVPPPPGREARSASRSRSGRPCP